MGSNMSKLFFSKEEKLTIENNVLKENNLSLQIRSLQNERQGLVKAFCDKNSKKTDDVVGVNIEEGSVEFKEEKEKKKRGR